MNEGLKLCNESILTMLRKLSSLVADFADLCAEFSPRILLEECLIHML